MHCGPLPSRGGKSQIHAFFLINLEAVALCFRHTLLGHSGLVTCLGSNDFERYEALCKRLRMIIEELFSLKGSVEVGFVCMNPNFNS